MVRILLLLQLYGLLRLTHDLIPTTLHSVLAKGFFTSFCLPRVGVSGFHYEYYMYDDAAAAAHVSF